MKFERGHRSYTWVKNTLQKMGCAEKPDSLDKNLCKEAALKGMMLYQDGLTCGWLEMDKEWHVTHVPLFD